MRVSESERKFFHLLLNNSLNYNKSEAEDQKRNSKFHVTRKWWIALRMSKQNISIEMKVVSGIGMKGTQHFMYDSASKSAIYHDSQRVQLTTTCVVRPFFLCRFCWVRLWVHNYYRIVLQFNSRKSTNNLCNGNDRGHTTASSTENGCSLFVRVDANSRKNGIYDAINRWLHPNITFLLSPCGMSDCVCGRQNFFIYNFQGAFRIRCIEITCSILCDKQPCKCHVVHRQLYSFKF